MKVYEFAKAQKLTTQVVLKILHGAGVSKTHNATLSETDVQMLGILQPVADASGAFEFDVNLMAQILSLRYSVKIEEDQVATAGEVYEATSRSLVKAPLDDVVSDLAARGVLPLEKVEAVDESDATNGEAPAQQRSGVRSKSLVLVQSRTRDKTRQDQDRLDWMQAVIDADREIRLAERNGEPFRPEWELSQSGLGVVYDDPFSQFLDSREFALQSRNRPKNQIYIPQEKYDLFEDQVNKSFQWRSNEILRKFERYLLSLWCVPTTCRNCGESMSGVSFEIKQLLREELFLPETARVKKARIYMGHEYHPWCIDLRRDRLRLAKLFEDYAASHGGTDSNDFAAFRTSEYQRMLGRVTDRHRSNGATIDIVLSAWKSYLRLKKEMIAGVR